MQLLSLDEIKSIELKILLEIDDICEAQKINYTLIGGSLLGAVRHSGFIPWDDDIDIAMPRYEYEQFLDYCENNPTAFKMFSSRATDCWHLFSKAYDPETVIVDHNNHDDDVGIGVHVDIFPIDGLSNNLLISKIRFLETALLRELLVAKNWKKYYFSKTRSPKYELIRYPIFIVSRFIPANPLKSIIVKIIKSYDFNKMNYVAVIPSTYRMREIVSKTVFSDYIRIDFEDNKISAINQYDYYLKKIYGNYWVLPPEEKRKSHHNFDAYTLD